MLTSDINVKFKRQLGYTNRKKIEHSKLVNLSDDLMKQYLIDNVNARKTLEEKLMSKHEVSLEVAKWSLEIEEAKIRNRILKEKYGIR